MVSAGVEVDFSDELVELTVTTAPPEALVSRSSQMLLIDDSLEPLTAPVVRVPSATEYGAFELVSVVAVSISNVIEALTAAVTVTWSESVIGTAKDPEMPEASELVMEIVFDPADEGLTPAKV